MTSKSLLESDVAALIIPFLGLKESLRLYVPLSKQCKQNFLHFFIQHKKGVQKGKPVEESGRLFSDLLDGLRLVSYHLDVATISPQAKKLLQETQDDVHALRQHGLYVDINRMNTAVYTCWNNTPMSPYSGVFQEFVKRLLADHEAANKAVDEDIQYWNSSRVYGDFIVLFDRPDGCILVSEDYQKVYLVLGIAQSLGEVCNLGFQNGNFYKKTNINPPQFHGPVIGIIISATMLNWQGMIVYDGLMVPKAMAGEQKTKLALKAYIKAVNNNTLITSLPKVKGTPKVILPPSVDSEQVRRLKRDFYAELNNIKNKSSRTRSKELNYLVFRRCGYTEEENPNHLITVLGPGVQMMPPILHQCQALKPTVEEYIQLLNEVVNSNFGKPETIGVDELSALQTLSAVLEGTGVNATYYPPPSEEEATLNDMTNPSTLKGCHACGKLQQSDGTKLLRCSRCKEAHYCCKEHQKKHWKIHKHMCVER